MKKLTTFILLTIGLLACNGQQADTLVYYTEEDLNELKDDYNSALADAAYTIDSLHNRISFLESMLESNEASVIADTYNLEIVDDRLKVEINKEGHNVWVNIIDGEKRVNADYVDYVRSVMLMDGTYTVGSMYIR